MSHIAPTAVRSRIVKRDGRTRWLAISKKAKATENIGLPPRRFFARSPPSLSFLSVFPGWRGNFFRNNLLQVKLPAINYYTKTTIVKVPNVMFSIH